MPQSQKIIINNVSHSAEKETPSSISGVSATTDKNSKSALPIEFGLDWLQGTFHTKYLDKVIRLAAVLFKGSYFEASKSGFGYFERAYYHPSGAVVATGQRLPKKEVNYNLSFLQFSGSVLTNCKQSKLKKFLHFLIEKCEFKVTRIDINIDDYNRYINIATVKKVTDQRKYIGFGNTVKYYSEGINASKGHGISFGKRGSKGGGKYLVIYDKYLESLGAINAIRIELSCYDIYAKEVSENLIYTPYYHWDIVIKSWISGSIDFVHRKHINDKNPGRAKRITWWNKIFKDSAKLTPSREYPKKTILKVIDWFRKQISPSFALLIHYFAKQDIQYFWDFFWDLVYDGESRFTNKHKYLLLTG